MVAMQEVYIPPTPVENVYAIPARKRHPSEVSVEDLRSGMLGALRREIKDTQKSSPLQMAQWALPVENNHLWIDTFLPPADTVTHLMGDEAFGAYTIWIPPGEIFNARGGDQVLFALAGPDSTIEYDGVVQPFEPGICGLVEANRSVSLQAGKAAMVLFGAGDRRLPAGDSAALIHLDQDPHPLPTARWAEYNPVARLLKVNTSPGPIQMSKSDGTATELVAIPDGVGVDLIRFGEGEGVKPHRHEGQHILPVLAGFGGTVMHRGIEYHVRPGVCYLIERQVNHSVAAGDLCPMVLAAFANRHRKADSPDRLEMTE